MSFFPPLSEKTENWNHFNLINGKQWKTKMEAALAECDRQYLERIKQIKKSEAEKRKRQRENIARYVKFPDHYTEECLERNKEAIEAYKKKQQKKEQKKEQK